MMRSAPARIGFDPDHPFRQVGILCTERARDAVEERSDLVTRFRPDRTVGSSKLNTGGHHPFGKRFVELDQDDRDWALAT